MYNDEDEDDLTYKKKYNSIQKTNSKYRKNKKNLSSDSEDNDEEQEESEDETSNKVKKKDKQEQSGEIKKTENDYLAQIEQLENELALEKKISNSIEDLPEYSEQIMKLQNNLNEKENKLSQLISTNKKQEEALNYLRRRLEKEIDKNKQFKKHSNSELCHSSSVSINNCKQTIKIKFMSPNRNNEISKSEAFNIVLKVKDKEINDALQKMNAIKKENDSLKKELYKNDDYTNNLSLVNSTCEYSNKIKELSNETKILNNQLEEHQKCLKEIKELNDEIDNLKKTFKELKDNIKKNKIDIKEKQNELEQFNTEKIPEEMVKKSFSPRNNLLTKYKNYVKFTRNLENENFPFITKSTKHSSLPKISTSQLINKNPTSVLNEDFCTKLKKFYAGKESEYNELVKKITEIEKKGGLILNKHRNELKLFNTQIVSLDEQFKILNNEGKGTGSNIKVLKFKLHTTKNEAKLAAKHLQNLKNKLNNAEFVAKERDYEISILLGQINNLKNKAKAKLEVPEDEMAKYVDNLPNKANEDKEIINKKTINNEKNEYDNTKILSSRNYGKKKVADNNNTSNEQKLETINNNNNNNEKDEKNSLNNTSKINTVRTYKTNKENNNNKNNANNSNKPDSNQTTINNNNNANNDKNTGNKIVGKKSKKRRSSIFNRKSSSK